MQTSPGVSADASAGTSAIQHTMTQVLEKDPHDASALRSDGLTTNATSMFWAMSTLRTHGTHAWVFGFPAPVDIRHDSQISVTLCELDASGRPFLGQATMEVHNVVPHTDGTVTVHFTVAWDSQLSVRFNFIIVN